MGDPARQEDVETFDGSESFTDASALAGRVLEQQALGSIDGVADVALESTLHEYEVRTTAEVVDGEAALDDAQWSETSVVTNTFATAPDEFREARTSYSYNDRFQQETSFEEGWLDETGDERCARTTYATDASRWMFSYPSSVISLAGDCDATEELSVSETFYDGSTTLGELPAAGNATLTRGRVDATTWTETAATYDALGRSVSVTDANGSTTTTSFTAAQPHGLPTETTVTNELGHSSTTEWFRQYQVPLREEDANGNVTTYGYDGLGRLDAVRLPTEQPYTAGKARSLAFAYLIDPNASSPPVVRTRTLTSEEA